MHNWFLLRGAHEKLTTDKKSQFLSLDWKDGMTFSGIQHIQSKAYYSERNDLGEGTI